mmetsp:Transcript_23823/g.49567  ORF Transcript_23823/g.49567 Transcript_23823/m.49567 type:complete len:404 (+) Transcript_23823:185-1396(+)|eukprot:CAMPEP_0197555196 /NCGR_PEP_ID=MMETSP1320-20131121/12871_1 /TAXON_ID=91990 /ORGANISM="Bolidomonas sp., Strain RCC2347" /LENGTH=403 /DNA_ID=CAMNT_0043116183 /DNA_START=109 /DNA_END=1320 /DNA_ORIENTATION=+
MAGSRSKKKRLRVISVNMCIAVSGLQNRILPSLCVLGGTTFGIVVFASIVMSLYLSGVEATTALAVLVASVPVISFGSFAYGARFGGLLGHVNTLLTGRHDHKVARLKAFAEALENYDVLLLQELYTSWPLWLDYRFDSMFIEMCQAKGFGYVARPAPAKFPSVCMGTGLMILSKHPILKSETLSFKNQFVAEQFGVNRGMMYAQVSLNGGAGDELNLVDLFTVHTTASMGEALLKGGPSFLIDKAEYARKMQFSEIGNWIRRQRTSPNVPLCIAGDFNANIKHKPTGGIKDAGKAVDIITTTMVKGLGFKDLGWKVTYGYIPADKVLTNPGHAHDNQVTEDLIFIDNSNCSAENFRGVPWLATAEQREQGFTHLSDHHGLAVDLVFGVLGGEEGAEKTVRKN